MAEAVLFNIAQEVLKNLGVKALDEIAATWGFKDRLEQLKNTINTIKDVLLDAEERQADNHAVRGWLEKLTTVIYSADDLFDEVVTVASRKQLMGGNKLTKEVRIFFSNSNQIAFALNISQKMKKIRQELDEIVKNSTEFAFVLRSHEEGRVISRRHETYSFVDSKRVVGRDRDKKAILDMLLASSSINDGQKEHPVIPIVGIGGSGKTTLAQLIYNDPEVHKFFELRLWVCVSDVFDVKEIVEQILASATNKDTPKFNMEQLQGRLREEVGGKKFLLVLDDVWNENREKWVELWDLLNIGRNGSTILVTTRSKEVAKIMGTIPPHELGGLSKEESWDLFEKMAFVPGLAQKKPHLVHLGKEMLNKCAMFL